MESVGLQPATLVHSSIIVDHIDLRKKKKKKNIQVIPDSG
jgi:hypothetical protein